MNKYAHILFYADKTVLEYNVEPGKKTGLIIRVNDPKLLNVISEEKAVICFLGRVL